MEILQNQKYSHVRGFNYFPGYAGHGLETWYYLFDPVAIEREISAAKHHFPGMNTLRIWLSHDAFLRDKKKVVENFSTVLGICRKYGIKVIPTLFNACHSVPDFGSISNEQINHFGDTHFKDLYPEFLDAFVGGNLGNEDILMWDLCNEPFNNTGLTDAKLKWLFNLHDYCKSLANDVIICVGINNLKYLEPVDPISDVITFHPYLVPPWNQAQKDQHIAMVDEFVRFSNLKGKALIATECCWGAFDDAKHVEIIRLDLGILHPRKIGFTPAHMCHSLALDQHRPDCGPVLGAEYMAFVERDGSLRPNHEVFNEFC